MRIDRLLAITTYLLNRHIVTGKELAHRYEVSERTIQRDIETINMAGIPIVSIKGIGGGYKIMDTFQLMKQPLTKEDMNTILLALEGLETALDHEKESSTLEKIKSISPAQNETISMDFSVVHENKYIHEFLKLLSDAILNKKVVSMTYSNAWQEKTHRSVEPVMIKYKWYTWYLVAYCLEKQDQPIVKT